MVRCLSQEIEATTQQNQAPPWWNKKQNLNDWAKSNANRNGWNDLSSKEYPFTEEQKGLNQLKGLKNEGAKIKVLIFVSMKSIS